MDAEILLIDASSVLIHKDSAQLIVSLLENANNLSLLISKHQIKTSFQMTKMSFYPHGNFFFFFASSKGKSSFFSCINRILCKMEDVCLCLSFVHSMKLKFAGTCWVRFFWSLLWEQLLSSAWSFIQLLEIETRLFFDLYLTLNFLMVKPGQCRVNLSPTELRKVILLVA